MFDRDFVGRVKFVFSDPQYSNADRAVFVAYYVFVIAGILGIFWYLFSTLNLAITAFVLIAFAVVLAKITQWCFQKFTVAYLKNAGRGDEVELRTEMMDYAVKATDAFAGNPKGVKASDLPKASPLLQKEFDKQQVPAIWIQASVAILLILFFVFLSFAYKNITGYDYVFFGNGLSAYNRLPSDKYVIVRYSFVNYPLPEGLQGSLDGKDFALYLSNNTLLIKPGSSVFIPVSGPPYTAMYSYVTKKGLSVDFSKTASFDIYEGFPDSSRHEFLSSLSGSFESDNTHSSGSFVSADVMALGIEENGTIYFVREFIDSKKLQVDRVLHNSDYSYENENDGKAYQKLYLSVGQKMYANCTALNTMVLIEHLGIFSKSGIVLG